MVAACRWGGREATIRTVLPDQKSVRAVWSRRRTPPFFPPPPPPLQSAHIPPPLTDGNAFPTARLASVSIWKQPPVPRPGETAPPPRPHPPPPPFIFWRCPTIQPGILRRLREGTSTAISVADGHPGHHTSCSLEGRLSSFRLAENRLLPPAPTPLKPGRLRL